MCCEEMDIIDKVVVSVIVPAYNVERFIKKCIDSLLDQSFQEIEIIVINDGSTDKTESVIRNNYGNETRLKYISQLNKGVSQTRNVGVDNAKGKYLLFVDGDDYLGKDYIKNLVECADQNDSDLVVAGYTMIDETGKIQRSVVPWDYVRCRDESVVYCICAVCSRLYRRDFWINNRFHFVNESEARGEDTPIAMKANLLARNIRTVPSSDYYYVQHNESAMKGLTGFQKYHFPYQTMEEILSEVEGLSNVVNDKSFFCVGVYKFLAQFAFQLIKGASKNTADVLIEYIYKIYSDFPNMKINADTWKIITRAKWGIDKKVAMGLFVIGVKYHCLNIMVSARR